MKISVRGIPHSPSIAKYCQIIFTIAIHSNSDNFENCLANIQSSLRAFENRIYCVFFTYFSFVVLDFSLLQNNTDLKQPQDYGFEAADIPLHYLAPLMQLLVIR